MIINFYFKAKAPFNVTMHCSKRIPSIKWSAIIQRFMAINKLN